MKREQRTYLRRLFRDYGTEGTFEDWLAYVTGIEVTLHPGARATAIHPETGVPLELRWDPETDEVMSFATRLAPGQPVPRRDVRLSAYAAALALTRGVAGGPRVHVAGAEIGAAAEISTAGEIVPVLGSSQPAAGKRPNRDFYRSLIAEVEAIYAKGDHPNPVVEVARRRGVQVGTVKSWLHRGRKYLKEER